jgi:hypothetical protein
LSQESFLIVWLSSRLIMGQWKVRQANGGLPTGLPHFLSLPLFAARSRQESFKLSE